MAPTLWLFESNYSRYMLKTKFFTDNHCLRKPNVYATFWQRSIEDFYIAVFVGWYLPIFCELKFKWLCLPVTKKFCYSLGVIVKSLHFLNWLLFFTHLSSMLLPPFLSMQLCHIWSVIDKFSFKSHVLYWDSTRNESLILFNCWRKDIVFAVLEFIKSWWN